MAYDIGPRIGIEGEKAFRDAIRTINAQMKALSSEMKVVGTEFDRSDNSMDALRRRHEVLEKQVLKQREALDKLKEGLQASIDAHGADSKVTADWQRVVNEATAKLNTLEKELKDNAEAMKDAAKPTEQNAKNVKELGDNADEAGKKTLTLGDIIKANLISDAIIGGIKALGSAVKGIATSAIGSAKEAAAFADEILTLSTVTGIATDTLQELYYMEELIDVSLDTMTSSMNRQIRSMANAQRGTKEAVEAYEKLGINIYDANGALRDSNEVFWEVIDSLGSMENETERDAIAMQLMGRSARDLVPLMELGSEGIKQFQQEAREMGAVLSEETLEVLGDYDDALQRLDRSKKILTNTFGALFAPVLEDITNSLVKYTTQFSKAVQESEGNAGKIGEAIGQILSDIVNDIVKSIPDIIEASKNIVMSFAQGLMANMPEIIPAAIDMINTLINGILGMLPEIVNAALQIVVGLAQGIAQSLPALVPTIVDTILLIVDVIIENLPLLVEAAVAIIIGLTQGIMEALPLLLERLPELVEKLVDALIESAPLLIDAGIEVLAALIEGFLSDPLMIQKAAFQVVVALIEGIVKMHVSLAQKGAELGKKFIEGIKEIFPNLKTIGKQMIEGLMQGITDTMGWVKDKVKNVGKTITDGFKDIFGIRSPSKLFKEEIGQNLALGIGEGFSDTMKNVSKSMQKSIPTKFDTDVTVSRGSFGDYDTMKRAFVDALKELNLTVVVDETQFGRVVNRNVAREVFA